MQMYEKLCQTQWPCSLKAWVCCCCSLAGFAGSNPAKIIDVCLLW